MRTSKIKTKATDYIRQGTLLCATPINPQADNLKTLVLITRHNNLGSSGIILNQPMGIKVHLGGLGSGPKVLELNYGGPDDDGLSFLISLPSFRNGWKDSIYWSRNLNELKSLLGVVSVESISFNCYKGSMRWLPGQLYDQVLKKYWWTTDDYSVNEITNNSIDTWSSLARKTGGYYAPLVDFENPLIFN